MTRLIDPNDIHSAIDTWSGFIYQGKIALNHVLKLLNEDENSNAYYLQLDSLEDFAIVKENYHPISLHQVKAVNSTYYSKFKESFEKLETRKMNFPCNNAYFHLAVKNEKTSNEIKSIHTTIDIYKYENENNFCSLGDINNLIENKISIYLNSNKLGHHNSRGNVTIIRNNLEAIIYNQVIGIHNINHERYGLTISEGAYYFTLPFSSFIESLEVNPVGSLDEDYYLFITKESLNAHYSEFCLEVEEEYQDDNEDIPNDFKEKLNNYLKQINSLNRKEIIKFIKELMPHREFKLNNIFDFKDNNIQKDELKDAFFRSLFELSESESTIIDGLEWSDTDSKKYTVTAINTAESNLGKICKRIYKNIIDSDYQFPYRADILITSGLEIDSIKKGWNKQNEIPNEEDGKNNITKWANISLTTLEKAKNKLR